MISLAEFSSVSDIGFKIGRSYPCFVCVHLWLKKLNGAALPGFPA